MTGVWGDNWIQKRPHTFDFDVDARRILQYFLDYFEVAIRTGFPKSGHHLIKGEGTDVENEVNWRD